MFQYNIPVITYSKSRLLNGVIIPEKVLEYNVLVLNIYKDFFISEPYIGSQKSMADECKQASWTQIQPKVKISLYE